VHTIHSTTNDSKPVEYLQHQLNRAVPRQDDQQLSDDEISPPLDRSTSMLNIVIHMLFASTGVLSVKREVEDKITLWCQQEKFQMST
jgi:hypothetical protein